MTISADPVLPVGSCTPVAAAQPLAYGRTVGHHLGAAVRTPWLAYHRPLAGARLRLFCFHHAGGGASAFRAWADLLQPYQVELCPVQLPGRENRSAETPYTNMKRLVDQLQKVLEAYSDLPLAFLGHSMGGSIAFALAQRFQQRAQPLHRLILSAATPPRVRQQQTPIHGLSDNAFLAEVARYNGLPPEILQNRELMAMILPLLRADFAMCERAPVAPTTILHCPISVYIGLHDRTVSEAELAQWSQQTIGAVKVRKFPGDHFFLYKQPNLVIKALVHDLFAVGS